VGRKKPVECPWDVSDPCGYHCDMELILGILLGIDKAVTLLKARRVRRQTLFKEVVEPIFAETEKIMANYDLIFNKLLMAIEKGDEESIRSGTVVFVEDRMQLKAVRTKAVRFANAALGLPANATMESASGAYDGVPYEIDKFRDFMSSAIAVSMNDTNTSRSSGALGFLRAYTDGSYEKKVSHHQLATQVRYAYEDSQKAWGITCSLFQELKLSYSLGVDEFLPTRRAKIRTSARQA
jgi:hypothetical protein